MLEMTLPQESVYINRSNLLVQESKAEMQKRGPLALTFAQEVALGGSRRARRKDAVGGYTMVTTHNG
jgi:hypothetical protein